MNQGIDDSYLDQKTIKRYFLNWIHFKTEFDLEKSKLILISFVMLFFGLTAVIFVVIMPDLLAISGISISGFPDPSITFILADFWQDSLIYSIMIILYCMGTFSSEIEGNKPIYFKLSRPISRRSYFITRTLIRIFGIFVVFFGAGIFTYLFGSLFYDSLSFTNIILASAINSLAVCSLASFVIMASAKFKTGTSAGIGFGFVIYQIIMLILEGPFEMTKWINPQSIATYWLDIINSQINLIELALHFSSLFIWVIVPILIGLKLFETRNI